MAKLSSINRNLHCKKLVQRFKKRRATLKSIVMDRTTSPEDRFSAILKMSLLPKNSAKERVRNRCAITGRPRATYRKFNMSRIALREFASQGLIPGVTKASW